MVPSRTIAFGSVDDTHVDDGGGDDDDVDPVYETNYDTRQHYNHALQISNDKMEPHALECVEFAQAVVDGAPSPVPAEQSLQVLSILDGIYRSQETGGEVRLDS